MYHALFNYHKASINQTVYRNFTTSATVDRLSEKVKGTIFENWFKFWKNVLIDYRQMLKDVHEDIKQKPAKTALYLIGFGCCVICAKSNPNEANFRTNYIKCASKLILVHPSCQNPQATNHLKYIQNCYNQDLIRWLNLGVLSVIWVDRSSLYCHTYMDNCSYLNIKFKEIFSRVLDVGFLGIWWNLSKNMLDYDINF